MTAPCSGGVLVLLELNDFSRVLCSLGGLERKAEELEKP